jgi:hypothetical protein
MESMADYPTWWFMVDILNLNLALQPYPNREHTFISAMKIQETENAMKDWAQKIKKGNAATHSMPSYI